MNNTYQSNVSLGLLSGTVKGRKSPQKVFQRAGSHLLFCSFFPRDYPVVVKVQGPWLTGQPLIVFLDLCMPVSRLVEEKKVIGKGLNRDSALPRKQGLWLLIVQFNPITDSEPGEKPHSFPLPSNSCDPIALHYFYANYLNLYFIFLLEMVFKMSPSKYPFYILMSPLCPHRLLWFTNRRC